MPCYFCIVFKYSVVISKFTASEPLGHYTFLHRINTFVEKIKKYNFFYESIYSM